MQAWIITLMPYVLLLGIWVYFVKGFMGPKSKYGSTMERNRQHMDRVEQQLERIAVALEKHGSTYGQPPQI